MTDLVQLTNENGIAVITINNPPVNALSPGVPEGIARAIDEINSDAAVKACVVIGAGRTFVSGADIKEFSKMRSGAAPGTMNFPDLLPRIEDCRKPVVMAIHGNALGGGLELAMAGHYRVARPHRASRPARSEARYYSRRAWHAASSPSRGRRQSRRDVRGRRPHQSRRSAEVRHH